MHNNNIIIRPREAVWITALFTGWFAIALLVSKGSAVCNTQFGIFSLMLIGMAVTVIAAFVYAFIAAAAMTVIEKLMEKPKHHRCG